MFMYMDQFSQADENPLSSGGVWDTGYQPFEAQVVNNTVRVSSPDGNGEAATVGSFTPGESQWGAVKVANFNLFAAAEMSFNVLLRATTSNDPQRLWYEIAVIRPPGGPTDLCIFDDVDLLGVVSGIDVGPGDVIKGTIEGTTIRAYQNGILLLEAQTSKFPSGRVGMKVRVEVGGSTDDLQIAEFRGGDKLPPGCECDIF
jgi:hypothetical protein